MLHYEVFECEVANVGETINGMDIDDAFIVLIRVDVFIIAALLNQIIKGNPILDPVFMSPHTIVHAMWLADVSI